ncbi:hypothetical protein IAT40_003391 [Kwoniella sp. CBS 6097]
MAAPQYLGPAGSQPSNPLSAFWKNQVVNPEHREGNIKGQQAGHEQGIRVELAIIRNPAGDSTRLPYHAPGSLHVVESKWKSDVESLIRDA